MVETGGRTGIAIAGLVVFGIAVFLIYHAHQSQKANAATSSSGGATLNKARDVVLGTADIKVATTTDEEAPIVPDVEEQSPIQGKPEDTTSGAPEVAVAAEATVEGEEENVVDAPTTAETGMPLEDEAPAPAVGAAAGSVTEATIKEGDAPATSTTEIALPPAAVAVVAATPESSATPAKPLGEETPKTEKGEKMEALKQQLTSIPVPKDDEIQAIFEEVDRNGDGKLTMVEVEKAIVQRKAQFDVKPTIVMRAFQKADADQDGTISREEFFSFVRFVTYFKSLSNIFDVMDADKNRRLNKDEFVKAAQILDVDDPETVFAEMDENKGGYVVFDEFCIWMAEKRHDEMAFQ